MRSHPQTPQELFAALVGRQHFQDLLTASASPRDLFLAEYMPMAERLAMCVQDLPLSPDVFKSQGGALQAGLQAGLLAVRSCDAAIFQPKATAQERQHNDPIVRWCAYCATLASVYLVCVGHVEVVQSDGEIFSFAGKKTLSQSEGEFVAKWREGPSSPSQAGLIYLQAFFYPGQFSHLGAEMLAMMAGAINPALTTVPNESPLGRVVRSSISKVIDMQRQRDAAVILPGAPAAMRDVPVEPGSSTAATDGAVQHASAVAPSQTTTERSAPASAESTTDPSALIAPKVVEWVKALANIRSLDSEIVVDDKGIRFGRKALAFGATPKDNYTALYEARVVLDKGADFARCNRMLARVYADEKSRATGGES